MVQGKISDFVAKIAGSKKSLPQAANAAVKPASVQSATSGAQSAAEFARLKEFYRQAEEYGSAGFRELESGRFRFYGDLKPAKQVGEMAGARVVREWDPTTGSTRTWLETLDQSGAVRQVRPETGGSKVHYFFDAEGNYGGTR